MLIPLRSFSPLRSPQLLHALGALLVTLCGLLLPSTASADRGIIKEPGNHPQYSFEAEPHVLHAPFDDDFGAGFRGSVNLVDNGFVTSINNSVALGFGADFAKDYIWLPVVLQWNFYLTESWSVFGEAGTALQPRHMDGKGRGKGVGFVPLIGFVGGRWHFSETLALTLRLGSPTVSLGLSIYL